MQSLYSRIALVLVCLVTAVGLVFMLMIYWVSDQYFQEVTQRLNTSIAREVVGEKKLILGGVANLGALEELAHDTMVINPTVEVYLLDPQGNILGHALDEATVFSDRVDLYPIRRFIAGDDQRPLKGSDPRSHGRLKIFSAAEIRSEERLEGYLYIILGGRKYDMIADRVGSTYVLDIAIASIVALIVIVLLTGLFVFRSLTLRLRNLSKVLELYGRDADADQIARLDTRPGGDEINVLIRSFVSMAKRIERQFRELNEAETQRRDLIANISHDLRTPLASMQGFIETMLLKDAELSSEDRLRFLAIARKHGKQLTELVSDLFELATLDAKATELKLESFSLLDLAYDIVQEFQLVAEEKGIELVMEAPEYAPLVNADIGLMQRALQNLISNAIRYTPKGGQVRFVVSVTTDSVHISISDTGSGVAPDILPHIFERFYRGQQNTAKSAGEQEPEDARSSAGLGLAIVKRILDLHAITIDVTSRLSEGTRFSFEMPVSA